MTLAQFTEQKAKFHEQENAVLAIQNEMDKAKNILEALQNEKAEFVARQKEKLAENGTLSADEYVELKNKNSGLEARIEYYTAVLVDLEQKLYQAKETLLNIQTKAKGIREHLFIAKADKLLSELLENNKGTLEEITGYLAYSGKFNTDNYPNGNWKYGDKSTDDIVKEYILKRISSALPNEGKIENEWKIHSPHLAGFTLISPMKKHADSFKEEANQPKGLSALINAL